MSNTVNFRLNLTENVTKQLRAVSKEFDKLGGKGSGASLFGNVGAKAVAYGFDLMGQAAGAAVGFIEDSSRVARDAEVAQAALANSLKNNAKTWDGTWSAAGEAVNKFAESQLRLGFTLTDTKTAFALALTSTKDIGQAMKEMSVAEDLARFKGIPLYDAVTALNRAFGGNFKALKALGIELPKGATQAEIMAAVLKKVGGAADAYSVTLDGKVAMADARLEAAQERIGGVINGVTIVAVENLSNLFSQLSGDPTKQATGALKVIEDAMGALGGTIRNVIGLVDSLFKALNSLPGSVGSKSPVYSPGHGFGPPQQQKPQTTNQHGNAQYTAPSGSSNMSGPGSVNIVGVTQNQLNQMIDQHLYVQLRRAGTGG